MTAPDQILLTGFMGTGKSTVGRLLARLLDWEFVDTDQLITERAGRSVAEIFAQQGEEAFRAMEAEAARELATGGERVIATGGRFLLDPANAALFEERSRIFCLTAPPAEILARIRAQGGVRPLLDVDDPRVRIEELLAERQEAYGRFEPISTAGLSATEVAASLVERLLPTLTIQPDA